MKKTLIWLIVFIMCVSLVASFSLAGCKEEAPDEEEIANETSEEEEAPAEEEMTEEADVEAEEAVEELGVQPPENDVTVMLSSWAWFDNEEQYNEMYAKFREKYPTIEIQVDRPAVGDYDAMLNTGLLGGSGPDIFACNSGGGMAGLVKYIDYALELDDLCVKEWGENWKDNFSLAALESAYWGTDKTIALPEYVQCYGSAGYYNKTMFDDLGISAPTTFAELLEVGKTLADNDIGPIANSGEAWTNEQIWMAIAADFAGTKLFDAIDGNASFTDVEFIEATDKLIEMYENQLFGTDPFSGAMYFDKINAFYEGKYGMELMGNWEFRVAIGQDIWGNQDPDVVFKNWVVPDWNEDGNPSPALVYPAILWTINKEAPEENQIAAWIVLKELVSGVFAEGRATQPNWMAFTSVSPDFSVLDLTKNGEDQGGEEQYAFWSDSIKNAIGVGTVKYPEIAEVLDKNILEAINGQKTAEEAMMAVEEASKALVRPF